MSLDFNRPSNPVVRVAYLAYLTVVGGLLGWVLHRDPDTYRYIPASIRRYPGAEGVARMFEARGFVDVEYRASSGGLMAIHSRARRAGMTRPWTSTRSKWSGEGAFTQVLIDHLSSSMV